MISEAPFIHRKNLDSTHESICMTCFLTVARGREAELRDAEENHDCERAILRECTRELVQQAS
jgi:hypothetical protein